MRAAMGVLRCVLQWVLRQCLFLSCCILLLLCWGSKVVLHGIDSRTPHGGCFFLVGAFWAVVSPGCAATNCQLVSISKSRQQRRSYGKPTSAEPGPPHRPSQAPAPPPAYVMSFTHSELCNSKAPPAPASSSSTTTTTQRRRRLMCAAASGILQESRSEPTVEPKWPQSPRCTCPRALPRAAITTHKWPSPTCLSSICQRQWPIYPAQATLVVPQSAPRPSI